MTLKEFSIVTTMWIFAIFLSMTLCLAFVRFILWAWGIQ